MSVINIVLLCLPLLADVISADNPIVETRTGKVSGVSKVSLLQKKQYYAFLGIPYAEPPLNDLRFMPPRPKQQWEDIWAANKQREACAQYYLTVRVRSENQGFFGNEDCLYLNVHTPTVDEDERLPVIVFTKNRNFMSSYNGSRNYSPDFFMEEGVVIVSFAHRLSSLGFLSFQDDLLPGNNGLRDIILVLEWVRDNIRSFGGDPARVTLMGSEGGAAAADLLLHSERARGLFHGVILQSGSSWNSVYLEPEPIKSAISIAELLEKKAGTSSSFVKNLKDVQARELTEKELSVRMQDNSREQQRGRVAFGPCVEHEHSDAVLTALPEETSFRIDVPIMMGFNSREGIEYSARYLEKPQFLTYADRDFMFLFPIRSKFHFKILHQIYYDAIQEVRDFYFEEGYVKVSKPDEYLTYSGDVMNAYTIDYTVRKYLNASVAPIYYYTFDYSGLLNAVKLDTLSGATVYDGTWGASLGDELCYLFVCNAIKKNYIKVLKDADESEEVKVLRRMVRMWSNFARTGNPTPDEEDDVLQGFKWDPATGGDKDLLEISNELRMRNHPFAGRIKFWDEFMSKYEELAVEGVVKNEGEEEIEEEVGNFVVEENVDYTKVRIVNDEL